MKDYAEFKKELAGSGCALCSLSAGRTQIVVDRGNPDAKVLVIGEAPGENEDLQGKAFVGRAGKLLDAMMLEEGFDTNRDCLIINVVKCRPPDNRRPTPDEAAACRPFFEKQIEFVRPRFVILLGATALTHAIPDKAKFKMGSEVGKLFSHPRFPDARVIVFYHPAYILRDPRKKPIMKAHIQEFIREWTKR
jgi:DNA polymerase